MAYEQVQKPSSSFVPVQKKVSEFAPSASRVQAKDVTAGEQEQMPLGSTPATDANWLMKHPLFKGNQFLQRVVAPASESESKESEEETLQRQEAGNESATPHSLPVQAKLTIGEPGDKYEQEADRVASQVVKQINSPEAAQSTQGQSVQRMEEPVEELQAKPSISDLQRSPLPLEVQREGMPADDELQAKSILQRREAIAGGEASTDLDTAINSARGSGQPLEAGLQRSMGQAMGADFSGVRVHTDAQSDQLNQSIQAKALTTGQDVFFRQGEYNPGSRGGQELIAHELTHVVQQTGMVSKSQSQKSEKIPSLSPQMQNEAKIIQPLRYKTDNTEINISSLSFMRVLDYLKRNDPDLDPGGVIFDNGDKATLQAQSDKLYPIVFNEILNFLGDVNVITTKTTRNIPGSVNLQNILTEMRARHEAGKLPGFREWLASVKVNLNVDTVLDKINELRAAQNIAVPVNVDESQIPGTDQTADLEHGNEQTEVKTIRQPIQGYQDLTGQVTAALGKFANVASTDGKIYNATIYCSINPELLTGKTKSQKGSAHLTRIDAANLDKIVTITRLSDGQQLNQTIENQLDKLLNNLNTQNWAGANKTHNIYIILENGTPQHLVRDATNNTWARA
jgi:hypothetical protein